MSQISTSSKFKKHFNQDFIEAENLLTPPSDLINLSMGDPDLPADTKIMKEAFNDTIDNNYTHYSPSTGYNDLREKIASTYKEDYNIEITKENVFIVDSATTGMYIALKLICDKDDEILVFSPYYIPYKNQIELVNGKMVAIDLDLEDGQISYEKLGKYISTKTKGIIVNSPSNPTGQVFNEDSLKVIAKIAEEKNLCIIADDIYTNLVYEGDFIPICKYSFNRTISIRSFSKDFCMTGFRIGYLIIPKDISNAISFINENISFTVPSICQRVALFALKDRKRILKNFKEEYKSRVEYSYERIKKIPFLKCCKPKGAIYLFVDIRGSGVSSEKFKKICYEKCHLMVMNGKCFGNNGEGFIRIALTCGIEKLRDVFDRLEKLKF